MPVPANPALLELFGGPAATDGNGAGDGRDDDGEANTNIDEPEPDPTPGGAGSAVNEPPDETDEDDLENLFNETIINANLKP